MLEWGYCVSKSFRFEFEHFFDRYNEALRGGMRDGILKSLYVGVGLALTFFIIFGSYALAFWVGTGYVYDGVLTPGTLLTVSSYSEFSYRRMLQRTGWFTYLKVLSATSYLGNVEGL